MLSERTNLDFTGVGHGARTVGKGGLCVTLYRTLWYGHQAGEPGLDPGGEQAALTGKRRCTQPKLLPSVWPPLSQVASTR
jgi:hypothetical protein